MRKLFWVLLWTERDGLHLPGKGGKARRIVLRSPAYPSGQIFTRSPAFLLFNVEKLQRSSDHVSVKYFSAVFFLTHI